MGVGRSAAGRVKRRVGQFFAVTSAMHAIHLDVPLVAQTLDETR